MTAFVHWGSAEYDELLDRVDEDHMACMDGLLWIHVWTGEEPYFMTIATVDIPEDDEADFAEKTIQDDGW